MSKWEKVKLGDVCDFIDYRGKTPTKSDSGIPLITAKNIKHNQFSIEPREYISEETYEQVMVRGFPKIGDVIFTTEAPLGNVCLIPAVGDKFAVGQRIIVMKPYEDKLSSYYMVHALRSKSFQYDLNKYSSGSTVKGIRSSELIKLQIPLPLLEVQKQIAKNLDTVSELLALRKKQLEELDGLIKSLFYDMFGDVFGNKGRWEKQTISSICCINPKKSEVNLEDNSQITFVPMNAVSEDGYIDIGLNRYFSEVKSGFTYFSEGDVLFAKITPCMENGKGAVARNLLNKTGFGSTEFHVLRPLKQKANSEWVYRVTSFTEFREIASYNMTGSAGQKRVPTSFFDKFSLPIPPLSLQNQFADIVTKIEEQKSLVKQSILETQTLFDSLMSQYFD